MKRADSIEFYNANDISVMVGVSRAIAYRIIEELNRELEKMNKFTFRGKISKKFFDEKMYI